MPLRLRALSAISYCILLAGCFEDAIDKGVSGGCVEGERERLLDICLSRGGNFSSDTFTNASQTCGGGGGQSPQGFEAEADCQAIGEGRCYIECTFPEGGPQGGNGGEPVGGEPMGGAGSMSPPVGGEPAGGTGGMGGEPMGGVGGESMGGVGGEPMGGIGGEPQPLACEDHDRAEACDENACHWYSGACHRVPYSPEEGVALGIEWIRIEGGSFSMGSELGVFRDNEDEGPPRDVQVPTFHIAKTEVTVAQYRNCVSSGACSVPSLNSGTDLDLECNYGEQGADQHPINCVTWEEASQFAQFIGVRLPTEAEWEFTAKSRGSTATYAWGMGAATCNLASFNEPDSGYGCGIDGPIWTTQVCSRPAGNTEQGLCDMNGNVEEWVQDYYGPYATAPNDGSANQVVGDDFRCHRGGSFASPATDNLRNTHRGARPQTYKSGRLGFRVAIDDAE
ncbi:MAG: formylglycine-generating enzyme family protein [Bradymonadia bacterium]